MSPAAVVPPLVMAIRLTRSAPVARGGTQAIAQLFCGVLLALPVHAGGALVVHLHAVHARITLAGFGIARNHERQRDELAAIAGPRLQDRNRSKVHFLATGSTSLQGAPLRSITFGKERADLRQHGEHLQLVHQTGRHLWFQQRFDPTSDDIQRICLERHPHTAFAAELVHQNAGAGMTFDILKQQRWPALVGRAATHFRGAISDLCHLEVWIDLNANTFQFAAFVQLRNPFAQVAICHVVSTPCAPGADPMLARVINAAHPPLRAGAIWSQINLMLRGSRGSA